jgi:hypothetical protein
MSLWETVQDAGRTGATSGPKQLVANNLGVEKRHLTGLISRKQLVRLQPPGLQVMCTALKSVLLRWFSKPQRDNMATSTAATLAQYQAIKAAAAQVATDQAALATDEATETTDQTGFASGLTGVMVAVNGDGTADVITPTPGTAPGYSFVTVPLLS